MKNHTHQVSHEAMYLCTPPFVVVLVVSFNDSMQQVKVLSFHFLYKNVRFSLLPLTFNIQQSSIVIMVAIIVCRTNACAVVLSLSWQIFSCVSVL